MTIMVIALATQMAQAHGKGSVLNIRLSNNQTFKIFVDGNCTGEMANRTQINGLADGRHRIEIYSPDNRGRGRGYGRMRPVFYGTINIDCNTETFATVNLMCNKIEIDRVVALCEPQQNGWNKPEICFYPMRPIGGPVPTCATPVPVGPVAMCAADLMQLKNTLHNAAFESNRLSIFKQALPYNYFSTAQVRELMNEFWFESTKLEVAKMAYAKTIDQQNYYQVNNEFTFSSSVAELSDYTAMR